MTSFRFSFFILAGLLTAHPASAAEREQINCIHDTAGEKAVRSIVGEVLLEESAAEQAYTDLSAATEKCKTQYAWSEIDAENSVRFALSLGASLYYRESLKAYGIDTEPLDQYLSDNYDWIHAEGGIEELYDNNSFQDAVKGRVSLNDKEYALAVLMYLQFSYLQIRLQDDFEAGVLGK